MTEIKDGDSAKKCHLSKIMMQEWYEHTGVFKSVPVPQRMEIKALSHPGKWQQ